MIKAIFKGPLDMIKSRISKSKCNLWGSAVTGKKLVIGCCLVLGIVWLQGCRSGPEEPVQVNSPQSPPQTSTVEVIDSAEHYATAYYYYAAAQLVLQNGELKEAIWLLERAVERDPDSVYLKIELAELLSADHKNERALLLIDQILTLKPDHLATLTLAGKIHQQRGELEKAKLFYEKALSANPVEPGIYVLLGRLYWNDHDLNNARRVFQAMAANIPDAYTAYYFLGKVFVSQGDVTRAIDAFRRALELDPSLEEPRLELIDIYKSQSKHEAVISAYLDLLVYHPQNHKATLALAAYYHQIGRSADGLPLLAEVGKQSRQNKQIIGLVFDMFLEPKRYKSAVWVLEGMLAGAPDNSELHYLAGAAYDGLGLLQPTLDHFKQVRVGSRFYPDAVISSALLYYNAGQMDQAIGILKHALVGMPDQVDFYYYLGTFHDAMKRFDEAVAAFKHGLAVDAENVRIQYQLGIVLDKMGHRQACIEAMKKVVQIDPDHAEALNYLGYTYAEMGIHLNEAEELILRALKHKPDDGYINDSLGWVYFKRGEYDRALEWLLKAQELVPDDPAILEHVGDAYGKLGQADRAMQFYQRSLKTNPVDRGSLEEKIRALSAPQVDAPPPDKGPAQP